MSWPTGAGLGTDSTPSVTTPSDYGKTDFGQTRVASPRRLLDLAMPDEINTDVMSTAGATGGAVTHSQAFGTAVLTVTGASGSVAQVRTAYQRYTAGAAQRILVTAWCSGAAVAGQVTRWGYYDDNDGLYFERRGDGTLWAMRRTSTSGSVVETGTQITAAIDTLRHRIYEIRFRYLGHGPARFYVDTDPVAVLEFDDAAPFMRTARLPVSAEVRNTGASTARTFYFDCSTVESEAGAPEPLRSWCDAVSVASVPTGETGLLALRLAATYAGVVNRGQVIPLVWTGASDGTQRARFTLRWRPTLLLPTGSWTAVTGSRTERRTALTAANAPSDVGVAIAVAFVSGGGSFSQDVRPLFDASARVLQVDPLSGAQPVLMITGQNEAAGTADLITSLTWGERA